MAKWTATNSEGFEAPAGLAVDAVVLSVTFEGHVELLAVRKPRGRFALIGGLVEAGESAERALLRVLQEKASIADLGFEQLAAFTDPKRDPRGWIPTVAFLALLRQDAADPGPDLTWIGKADWGALAYDHSEIARAGIDRVRGKLWWSNVVAKVIPAEFTMRQARTVYEAFASQRYDPSTFSRDLLATGLVESTGKTHHSERGRPAGLYRFKTDRPAWGAGRRKRVAGA